MCIQSKTNSFETINDNCMLGLGDCLDLMQEIPDKSVDFCLTDPPYGTTACKWDSVIHFEPMWTQLKRIVKDNGAIALFGSEPFSSHLRLSNIKMFRYDWIYEKTEAKGHLNAKKRPLSAHETISIFYKKQFHYYPQKTTGHVRKISLNVDTEKKQSSLYGKQKTITNYDSTERYPRSVILFKTDKQKCNLHPTQKPVALLEYLIKTYTLEGETVLDFTMGSGSAGVACKNLNRKFIGIEKDKGYFEIAEKRIQETSLQTAFNIFNQKGNGGEMIYPTVKLEEWIKEHNLKIQEFKCPKCGKNFTTLIPVISKEYVGLTSPIHDCGQAFIKMVLKPIDIAKIQFWYQVIQNETNMSDD